MRFKRFAVEYVVLVLLVAGFMAVFLPAASAYPYPSPLVECENYVFVPRNPDGTWTCPPPSLEYILDLFYRFITSIFRSTNA